MHWPVVHQCIVEYTCFDAPMNQDGSNVLEKKEKEKKPEKNTLP